MFLPGYSESCAAVQDDKATPLQEFVCYFEPRENSTAFRQSLQELLDGAAAHPQMVEGFPPSPGTYLVAYAGSWRTICFEPNLEIWRFIDGCELSNINKMGISHHMKLGQAPV